MGHVFVIRASGAPGTTYESSQSTAGLTHTYLVSSRYHSKSGAGTAEASHFSEACRPVVASLLLDSVIVGGSVGRTGTEFA